MAKLVSDSIRKGQSQLRKAASCLVLIDHGIVGKKLDAPADPWRDDVLIWVTPAKKRARGEWPQGEADG